MSCVILVESSITDLSGRLYISLNEVHASSNFIRVTFLEKELLLDLFSLQAPASDWAITCNQFCEKLFSPTKKIKKYT